MRPDLKKIMIIPALTFIAGLVLFSPRLSTAENSALPVLTEQLRLQALDYTAESLRRTVAELGDSFPVATEQGVWKKDSGGWTGGYFAGMLWLMYIRTGDSYWLDQARRYTGLLEGNKSDDNNIDIGILFWPSFALGYSASPQQYFRETALEGARTMLKRFIPGGGYLQNWGALGNKEQMGYVIIDCLINLDLLYWATDETGDSVFARAATSHAERTRIAHVRPDNSSYQVVELDPATGRKLRGFHKQGYADESTWSRGQAWGIYGFSRVYFRTGDPVFMETAMKMADWFIDHLPADYVPYWDFSAPGIPDDARDSSAGSMAASGMLEIAAQVKDPEKSSKYREAAGKILSSLTRNYLTRGLPGNPDGVLTGGTYFYQIGSSVNQANIWGDFYYLEALLRWAEKRR